MQLYHATALVALVLIVVLSAGYAAAERTEQEANAAKLTYSAR